MQKLILSIHFLCYLYRWKGCTKKKLLKNKNNTKSIKVFSLFLPDHHLIFFLCISTDIKIWRPSSLMLTWCLTTAKSSMKTIQTLVEQVTIWGSFLRSAGLSFWNKQTKQYLFRFFPVKTVRIFQTSAPPSTDSCSLRTKKMTTLRDRSEKTNSNPWWGTMWFLLEKYRLEIKMSLHWGALDFLQQG